MPRHSGPIRAATRTAQYLKSTLPAQSSGNRFAAASFGKVDLYQARPYTRPLAAPGSISWKPPGYLDAVLAGCARDEGVPIGVRKWT